MTRLTDEQISQLIEKHGIDMNQPIKERSLGSFQLGERARITDPCYSLSTWCAGGVDGLSPGEWMGYAGLRCDPFDIRASLMWINDSSHLLLRDEGPERDAARVEYIDRLKRAPGRVHWLIAVRKDMEHLLTTEPFGERDLMAALLEKGTLLDVHVGVDSGQAGIFDLDYYVALDSLSSDERDRSFYDPVCDITCDSVLRAGTIDKGVVSSSGFGDGGYSAYTLRDADEKVIAIGIEYISLEEDEEEEV